MHTAPTEIYTLSLHDALPILGKTVLVAPFNTPILHAMTSRVGIMSDQYTEVCCNYDDFYAGAYEVANAYVTDRKSTRLNSSHGYISYAVFCLKKKKKKNKTK